MRTHARAGMMTLCGRTPRRVRSVPKGQWAEVDCQSCKRSLSEFERAANPPDLIKALAESLERFAKPEAKR